MLRPRIVYSSPFNDYDDYEDDDEEEHVPIQEIIIHNHKTKSEPPWERCSRGALGVQLGAVGVHWGAVELT